MQYVFACGDLGLAFADQLTVAEHSKFDVRGRGGFRDDAQVERFTGVRPRCRAHGRNAHVWYLGLVERYDIDGYARRDGCRGRAQRITPGGDAIAQNHDSRGRIYGHFTERASQRGTDVGAVAADFGPLWRRQNRVLAQRIFHRGAGAERNRADSVVLAHADLRDAQLTPDARVGAGHEIDAAAAIDGHDHRHPIQRPAELDSDQRVRGTQRSTAEQHGLQCTPHPVLAYR